MPSFVLTCLVTQLVVRREKLLGLMDRLDPTYAAHKRASVDKSKSDEERAQAAELLAKREQELQPAYKSLALLYADLHECVTFSCSLRCGL